MKKTIIISMLALATTIKAQIKIFPGGSATYGTTSTNIAAKHHFVGNFLAVSSASNVGTNSAALLRGNNGYSGIATPDYTWLANDQTGLFHPAANVIGFTIGGSEAMRIYNNKKLFIGTQPNTTTPALDGQLTIANLSAGDRALVINHTATGAYQSAVVTTLTHSLSSSYNVVYNGTASFYVMGTGWVYNAGGIYNGSDINIKDDIKSIDSASAKINRIKGVTYTLKKEKQNLNAYGGSAKEYMGVIAQDIEKVAPQAVKTIHDGTKAVCYDMLIGLLIEGFKEQSAKVAQLESDLNTCCAKSGGGKTTQRSINSSGNYDNNSFNDAQSFIKQNKPNPFSNETIIEYNIVSKSNASSIMIFDMNGKLLKTYPVKEQGKGQLTINGKELTPGLYHYSLVVDGQDIDTKKMIITE